MHIHCTHTHALTHIHTQANTMCGNFLQTCWISSRGLILFKTKSARSQKKKDGAKKAQAVGSAIERDKERTSQSERVLVKE